MLRPLLLTFVNFYFVDWLVGAALLEACYFVLLHFWSETVWWQFLIQLPIGIVMALACRYVQDRWRSSLLVLTRAVSDDWMWTTALSVSLALCTLLYPIELTNTGDQSLQSPFSSGAFMYWALVLVLLFVAEAVAYTMEFKRAKFRLLGLYPLCGLVISAVVAIDLLAFKQAYYLVLIAAALMLPLMLF